MPGGTGRDLRGGSEWRKRDVIQGHHTHHSPVHAQAFDGALIVLSPSRSASCSCK